MGLIVWVIQIEQCFLFGKLLEQNACCQKSFELVETYLLCQHVNLKKNHIRSYSTIVFVYSLHISDGVFIQGCRNHTVSSLFPKEWVLTRSPLLQFLNAFAASCRSHSWKDIVVILRTVNPSTKNDSIGAILRILGLILDYSKAHLHFFHSFGNCYTFLLHLFFVSAKNFKKFINSRGG